jgi:hypothetical protein
MVRDIQLIRRFILTQVKGTRNPIYYFYERVERNANGEIGNAGDKHYRCFHGNWKVVMVTKKMKYSLNGMSLQISGQR